MPHDDETLSLTDRRVLSEIQARFPLTAAPYGELAGRLGLSEDDVAKSVRGLRADGIVRRIGAIFDSNRLGYRSTLCAMAAPPERVEECADLVSCYPNVTHNYQREDRYNVWFTLIARSQARIDDILREIAATTGVEDILDLPAIRLFKIRVDFDLTGERAERADAPPVTKPAELVPVELTPEEIELVRLLQDDLPAGPHPFAEIAWELQDRGVDADEGWVLDRTSAWVSSGVIRRFGAAIKHHKTGYTANAMGVWDVPEERMDEVGRVLASFKETSHVYQRPNVPTWPHDLYTMIHGRSREECEEVATRMQAATGLQAPRLLYSVREFKKTSMRYFAEDE